MPNILKFDFVSIGAGSAGFNAARIASSLGRKVAIVDGARDLGGLCILKGCMPSKTLLWSAEVLHLARKAIKFGLTIPNAGVDMPALHLRKSKIIGEFASHRFKQLNSKKFNLYRKYAKFLDPHTIQLSDGQLIQSKHFHIATGSTISTPNIPGLAESQCWTSDDILDLDHIPKSIIVLGGGIVACELSQFLARIGSRVIQIQRSPNILKEYSLAASSTLTHVFEKEGIELHTDTEIRSIKNGIGGYTISFLERSNGKTYVRKASRLLNALGREPNTSSLSLQAAGVALGPQNRIIVNKWQQTSQHHIYAGGDVCGPHDIVHLAVAQGELAARHACGVTGLRPVASMPLLTVTFTDPQIATIGASERSLLEANTAFLKASYPFNDHGKSILMDEMEGHVTVYAERKTGRILGAEIVGPNAGELIHCFSTPLTLKATVNDMLRAPWYHPTLAEIITYPLEEIADEIASKSLRSTRPS